MPTKIQKTLVIDLDRCIECFSCEVACKQENSIDLDVNWNKVMTIGPAGKYPDVEQYYLPTVCQQCEDPECVKVCPTGASFKREADGVVLINREICIGCRYCMMACPYGVRNFNKEKKVVEKCTLCIHLTDQGGKPACVKNCPGEARFFGDLNDPQSEVSKVVATAGSDSTHALPDVGNRPSGRYILHRKNATWRG